MGQNTSSHISIAEQIIEGSITIKSIKEFGSILKIFPNDADLQKAYSDLLVKKNKPDNAIKSYDKAAKLFIDAGKILPAIDSKMLQWKIKPPSTREARSFYAILHNGNYNDTPLETFFQRLSYQEMLAIVSKMVRLKLSPGKMIKKIGDRENDLYFVVSGNLKETVFFPLGKKGGTLYRKKASFLSENQFFGEIYPFKNNNTSKSYIETSTRAELVRITKSNLIRLCKKHPDIEMALIDLYNLRKTSGNGDALSKVRRIRRHQMPLKIDLCIYTDANQKEPLVLDGYSRDISIGGCCVILDAKYKSIASIYKNIKAATIEMSLPNEELALKVSGKIVWSREFTRKKRKFVALGFQFKEMSPKFRGLFFMMADSMCNNGGQRT